MDTGKLNQACKYFLGTYGVQGYMEVADSCHLVAGNDTEKSGEKFGVLKFECLQRVKWSTQEY